MTNQNTVAEKTHVKKTDKNSYLHYVSYHTKQLRENLAYNQFLYIETSFQDYRTDALKLTSQ